MNIDIFEVSTNCRPVFGSKVDSFIWSPISSLQAQTCTIHTSSGDILENAILIEQFYILVGIERAPSDQREHKLKLSLSYGSKVASDSLEDWPVGIAKYWKKTLIVGMYCDSPSANSLKISLIIDDTEERELDIPVTIV